MSQSIIAPLYRSFAGYLLLSAGLSIGCGSEVRIEPGASPAAKDPPRGAAVGYLGTRGIVGVAFRTDTLTGVTGGDGAFFYHEGESITFSVGDVRLGPERPAKREMSTFDLVGLSPPTTGREIRLAMSQLHHTRRPTKLDLLINLEVFLQTLDQDGDALNGITIHPALHQLKSANADGGSLRLDRQIDDFRIDATWLSLVESARAVWGPIPVATAGAALDSAYAWQEITPSIEGLASEVTHTTDGSAHTITYAYDDRGRLSLRVVENASGGDPLAETTWTYGERDELLVKAALAISSGGTSTIERHDYDANGRLAAHEHDVNADGSIEARHEYTYGAHGRLVERKFLGNFGNGPPSYLRLSYHPGGMMARAERSFQGSVTESFDFQVDASGRLAGASRRVPGAAVIVDVEQFWYNPHDEVTQYTVDYDGDGQPDTTVLVTYDNAGRMTHYGYASGNTTELHYNVDGTFGGLTRTTTTGSTNHQSRPHYDADARLVSNDVGNNTVEFAYVTTNSWRTLFPPPRLGFTPPNGPPPAP